VPELVDQDQQDEADRKDEAATLRLEPHHGRHRQAGQRELS
jgi:hypothetical protein